MIKTLQELAAEQALENLFHCPERARIELSHGDVWCLVSAIQLACRHPQFQGPIRDKVESIARSLGEALVGRHPGLLNVYEAGWPRKSEDAPAAVRVDPPPESPEAREGKEAGPE